MANYKEIAKSTEEANKWEKACRLVTVLIKEIHHVQNPKEARELDEREQLALKLLAAEASLKTIGGGYEEDGDVRLQINLLAQKLCAPAWPRERIHLDGIRQSLDKFVLKEREVKQQLANYQLRHRCVLIIIDFLKSVCQIMRKYGIQHDDPWLKTCEKKARQLELGEQLYVGKEHSLILRVRRQEKATRILAALVKELPPPQKKDQRPAK